MHLTNLLSLKTVTLETISGNSLIFITLPNNILVNCERSVYPTDVAAVDRIATNSP